MLLLDWFFSSNNRLVPTGSESLVKSNEQQVSKWLTRRYLRISDSQVLSVYCDRRNTYFTIVLYRNAVKPLLLQPLHEFETEAKRDVKFAIKFTLKT